MVNKQSFEIVWDKKTRKKGDSNCEGETHK